MDISGIEATQALDFGDGGDETDEDIDFNTPVAYLNVRCQKGFPGKLFPIYEGDNIIGRHDGCQVAIPLKALSREHACIEVSAGSHFIYDKGSRNRTKRNKHFLAAAVRYELKDKDKLIFGDVETEFQLHPANNNDDGSDTESESMFQTAPADDVVVPAEDDDITAPAAADDDDDDGCDSDASCDILQPTQQFTKNTQSTSIFGTKAQLGETTIAQNITVEDTPEINRTKRLTDSIVIPESGSDTEGEEEICKDKSGDISRLMVAETQSYVCESDVTTDDEDNSVDKSSLLVAPTQAFVQGKNDDDDDISTCDEASPQKKQLMMAATQAYVDSDDHASPKKKIMFEPTQAYDMDVEPTVESERKVGVEPTVHYDMDEGVEPTVRVEPTQAYDIDTEEEDSVKTEDEKQPGILFEPTQAYTGYDDETEEDDDSVTEASEGDKVVGFDDPTLAVETVNSVDDESETPVVEEQSEKVGTKSNVTKDDNNEAETQVCDEEVGSKSNVPVNDNETETQICDEVPDESEKSNDNKVEKAKSEEKTTQGFDKQADPTQTFNDEDGDTFDFLATSTLAVDDVDSGESNTSSAKDTADVDFNQPTQVFDNVDETCAVTEDTMNDKPKWKVCSNNEDATQVFNNDTVAVQDNATVAVEDVSKDSKGSNKARKSKITKKQCVAETVPNSDNDGQTQVFDQTVDINKITEGVKPAAKCKAAINASDQPTQVFDETVPVEDMTDVKDSAQSENEGPTQVFDEIVPVEDIKVTKKAKKQTRATTTKNEGGSEMDQDTQVFDDTLAVEETSVEVKQTRGGKMTKKSARNKKQSAMEDATQVFDETVAVEDITNLKETTTKNANKINSGDQPTQVFDETLPVYEIPDIKTNTTKRGKKQAIVENQIAEDEPTQVFDEPSTSKSEDLKAGEDQTQVFEENVEEAAIVSKPVRKGKKGAKKAQDNNASTTTEGSTQVFDETVVSQDLQGSSEGATQVFEDTESVSEETNVKPGVRKGGRRKQTKTDAANDTVETNNTRTSRTRGRGSKTATNRQTESEEKTIANENVKESVHPKNSGRNEPSKDTDEVAEQPIDSVRKSGRTKRNSVKKDAEKEDVPKVSIENKKGKKKANKPTVETEAATQLYGDEEPSVTDTAATQRYGDDNEEEDLTPDIDTVLAEEANQRNVPPVVETVIPAKSPLKSALASPKKERSPSPKKVQFVSQKSETGSESSQTSRRSNRSNKGKSKYSVDKDASDSKPVPKNSKNKKDDETTNISETIEEKVAPVRRGRGRRAVQSIDPVQDTETVSDNVKQTEVTSKRQGRSKTSDNSSVKNESENTIEEAADLTENPSKVIKRGGRKSTNSVSVNQKTRKNTRTSLPTVLEDKTDNSSTEKSKTNARQGNHRGAKRKVEETSDAKNMDDEQNVVADDVKEKPSTSKGSKNKEEESESVINNEESKGAENDNTDNSSLRPSRRGTRHTESNESTVDISENANSDKKASRGKGVKKDVKSDNVKVDESNASEVETTTDNVEVKGNSQKGNDSVASKSESDSQVGVNRRGKRNSEVSTSKSDMDTRVQKTQEKVRGNKRSTRKNAGGDADTINDTTDNKDSIVKKEDEDSQTTRTTGRVTRKVSISSSIDSQESESSGTPAKKQKKGKASAVSTPVTSNKQPKQLDESITHSPQLRKTTIEGVKAKVMFTGVVDEQGQKIVKELGGELVNAVMDCTHLVTDQVRRTVKFLCCLARGIPIVVPQWLISSKASGFFVDSAPFLVTDDATEKKFKFRLMHSIEKANQERLFEGYTIHVTKSVKPEPMQMKEILNCAGAKYSDKMPSSNTSGHTVVISCEEDKSLCTAAVNAGIPVMTAEFVLTGILRQDVDLVSFKLDMDTKGNKRSQPDSESEPAKKRRR